MVLLNNFIHHFDFVNTFSFSFFLNNFFVKSSNEKLIPLKEYIKDKNTRNNIKFLYDLVSEYLSIWEEIDTIYISSNKINSDINTFLRSKNPDYTPPIINNNKVLNNNYNNHIS